MVDTPAPNPSLTPVALALQGGGSHGAFTWGVLDRLAEEVAAGRLSIAGLSGASAGAINAALFSCGLAIGGADAARAKLRAFWEALARRGFWSGNSLFGFADPGAFGFNIDWSPGAILLEAASLVVSPYTNVFYADPLAPLLENAFSAAELDTLNRSGPRIFVSATNVRTDARRVFTQPEITRDVLRASAALPTEFRAVEIAGEPYWDGGYLGNPALNPLIDVASDLLLVLVNPLGDSRAPPIGARQILDRLNQITFNASVVLETNAIEAVNRVLAAGAGSGGKYKPVRLHLIRNERFLGSLGFVSKSSTSWPLLEDLFEHGRATASAWVRDNLHRLGRSPSVDLHAELITPLLNG